MSALSAKTILVVEDDDSLRWYLQELLTGEGYQVLVASSGTEGLRSFHEHHPDLLLTDLVVPHGGIELIHAIRQADPRIPIIIISGNMSPDAIAGLGANALLHKPFPAGTLFETIAGLLHG